MVSYNTAILKYAWYKLFSNKVKFLIKCWHKEWGKTCIKANTPTAVGGGALK